MNKMTKMTWAIASLVSVGALTACQSTTAPHSMQNQNKHDRHVSAEHRKQFKDMRIQHHQAIRHMKQACNGQAVGQKVQIKVGENMVDGTCVATFKPDRGEMKRVMREGQPNYGQRNGMHGQRGEAMTDEKRAALVKQYDQRLAERQAHQQAVLQACQGKKDGTAVQLKWSNQTVKGTCNVRFQPKHPLNLPSKSSV